MAVGDWRRIELQLLFFLSPVRLPSTLAVRQPEESAGPGERWTVALCDEEDE